METKLSKNVIPHSMNDRTVEQSFNEDESKHLIDTVSTIKFATSKDC